MAVESMRTLTLWLLVAALLMPPSTGFAWGEEGHRVIGLIADHYLTPAVRQKIASLLAQDDSGLADSVSIADESLWADRYRDSDRDGSQVHYRQTQSWHYVDLEVDRPDLAAACRHRACIVDKIEQFRGELAGTATAPGERLLALQFLLHFVGDLHQPLHAADEHDRGGNEVLVTSGPDREGNLHQYWDSVFVAGLGTQSEAVAQRLIAGISPQQLRDWSTGSPTDWAYESFALAKREVYGKLPPPDAHGTRTLDDKYMTEATATVAVQLQRAGVRLAKILNDALG
jgi:hypothetical protein